MVRASVLLSCLLILSLSFLSAGEISSGVETEAVYLNGRGDVSSYIGTDVPLLTLNDTFLRTDVSLSYTESKGDMKGEVKGKVSYSALLGEAADTLSSFSSADFRSVMSFSIEKAYMKFRFPLLNSKRKTTVTVGKAPVSWGKGYWYRTGDVLLESEYTNDEAGVSTSRSLWALLLEQGFPAGITMKLGYSIPLERQKSIIALNLSKTLDTSFLKGAYLSYAYRCEDENRHRLSLSLDGTLFFDFTAGVETLFRDRDDFSLALNLLRQFPIETETAGHTLGLYLCGRYSFHERSGEAMFTLTYDVTERLTSTLSGVLPFTSERVLTLTLSPSVEFTVNDYATVKASGIFMRDFEEGENIYGVSLVFSSSF